jgi:hypothetical protein
MVRLIGASDARLRELLAGADIMTEGCTVEEHGQLVYYGSTSVQLSKERAAVDIETLALLARFDPHLRTRVVRLACTESISRAGAPMESIHTELSVLVRDGSVVMVVDLTSVVRGVHANNAQR